MNDLLLALVAVAVIVSAFWIASRSQHYYSDEPLLGPPSKPEDPADGESHTGAADS